MDYFLSQLDIPYQSTISFCDFLDEKMLINRDSTLIDACCGSGANSFYIAKRYNPKSIIGFDYQEEFLSIARNHKLECYELNRQGSQTEISFMRGDVYNSTPIIEKLCHERQIKSVNGVILLQTLSWLTDWRRCLSELTNFKPGWIALSSLFYDGLIEAEITIKHYPPDSTDIVPPPLDISPYNVYSVELVEKFFREMGYVSIHWREFNITVPLERPSDKHKMGTYTIETSTGNLMQVSGPLLMPWRFLIAER